ncbi:MAG: hypothetical protein ABJO67_17350 [Pseudoruegeria sp.]
MKAGFMVEQIIEMIKEQDAGEKTADICGTFVLRGLRRPFKGIG